ncbi:helix-turn-helix domain-containing protein [Streptomyces sp. NBC_00237]|uniref:helix-turn-helix domain-containing protein n=1 Tax=Streptomyces sp. NBC_00237 TaxID=2975687 RepID=UPI00224CCD27|nr:helix-turn-helix domain-containing protein [Streptomyces sp. NBC_00237]MCX5202458.1 helix-turn-helix domain-containing protein [Streptomyces sp. NBC_00237]
MAPVTPPVAGTGERWNLWVTIIGFAVILGALALVAVVGMRVSWVPLRDTADTIGLSEVRQYYPLVIDLLDGLAIVASIALYGTPGYRWAIGTVIGLTAISLTLNVAHGSAAGGVTGASDATTWGHVILASAAPTICIGLGAHLAALTWGRVAGAVAALRSATQGATPLAPSAVESASARVEVQRLGWEAAVPPNARFLPIVAAATPLRELTDGRDTRRGKHLTTAEVAARLGKDPATVRSWVTRGRLKPVATDPSNGSHLFDAAAVAALN